MVADIKAKAETTEVFTGKIEQRQTLCPKCGKPAGEGKFCNNCGAPLALTKCPQCGVSINAGARFCGECGAKIA
jgi:predicted amidophosphoribosyltransferase